MRAAIDQFDGVHIEPLERVGASKPSNAEVAAALDYVDGSTTEQQAATWLVLRWARDGFVFDSETATALVAASSQFESWQADLHFAQLCELLDLSDDQAEDVVPVLEASASSERPFLRAWAMTALAALANGDEELSERVDEMLAAALDDGAASVRARARKLLAK